MGTRMGLHIYSMNLKNYFPNRNSNLYYRKRNNYHKLKSKLNRIKKSHQQKYSEDMKRNLRIHSVKYKTKFANTINIRDRHKRSSFKMFLRTLCIIEFYYQQKYLMGISMILHSGTKTSDKNLANNSYILYYCRPNNFHI